MIMSIFYKPICKVSKVVCKIQFSEITLFSIPYRHPIRGPDPLYTGKREKVEKGDNTCGLGHRHI
jgi:hypothetical protein